MHPPPKGVPCRWAVYKPPADAGEDQTDAGKTKENLLRQRNPLRGRPGSHRILPARSVPNGRKPYLPAWANHPLEPARSANPPPASPPSASSHQPVDFAPTPLTHRTLRRDNTASGCVCDDTADSSPAGSTTRTPRLCLDNRAASALFAGPRPDTASRGSPDTVPALPESPAPGLQRSLCRDSGNNIAPSSNSGSTRPVATPRCAAPLR